MNIANVSTLNNEISEESSNRFWATTYLTQQERLLDTAPQLLILFLFESVVLTDSNNLLKSIHPDSCNGRAERSGCRHRHASDRPSSLTLEYSV